MISSNLKIGQGEELNYPIKRSQSDFHHAWELLTSIHALLIVNGS